MKTEDFTDMVAPLEIKEDDEYSTCKNSFEFDKKIFCFEKKLYLCEKIILKLI